MTVAFGQGEKVKITATGEFNLHRQKGTVGYVLRDIPRYNRANPVRWGLVLFENADYPVDVYDDEVEAAE